MSLNATGIEWTDFSASPLRYRDASGNVVWGCVKCSEGCKNCYSEALAKRYGRGGPFSLQQMQKLTPFLDDKVARELLTSKKLSGKRVFIDDMTDLFGEWVPDEIIDQHFAIFSKRSDVTFQVLTKRSERMEEYFRSMRGGSAWNRSRGWDWNGQRFCQTTGRAQPWPLPNLWLGTSIESGTHADRADHLRQCPAAVRFISYEPALGPLAGAVDLTGIHWLICGGESGRDARPFNVKWARDIIAQCKAANVACFVKQLGSKPVQFGECDCGCMEHGRHHQLCPRIDPQPMKLRDRKGGDPDEWDEDLRVREFPEPISHSAAKRDRVLRGEGGQ